MASGIYTALSGAMSDVRRIEVLSNNLANVSTPAFKQFRMALEAARGPSQSNELTFAMPTPTRTDVHPGPITATGNPLDLALGSGVYLSVLASNQESYVRGGTLVPMPNGRLVTEEGLPVIGEEDVINLPPGTQSVTIGADGSVEADGVVVDRLRLVEFQDQQALRPGPSRTVIDPGGAGPMMTAANQPVMSGYREESNVNLVQGMTELITAQRNYESAVRALETFSHVEKRAARDISSV